MSALLTQIFALLNDVIVPQLQSMHASQTEQRLETDRLDRNLEEFRLEMQIRFAALHAELAATHQEIEDALVTLREREPEEGETLHPGLRKRTVH